MSKFSEAFSEYSGLYPESTALTNEPMWKHTPLRIGGEAECFFEPRSADELCVLIDILRRFGLRTLILGNGSNILFSDKKLEIAVVSTRRINNVTVSENTIIAEAGASLRMLSNTACENSLGGIEFLNGIPGTVGGAVCMNAGAYGGEIKESIQSVTVITPENNIKTLAKEECGFSYRDSYVAKSGMIVLSAVVSLSLGDADCIRDTINLMAEKRRLSQPLNYPSLGSTFKRPKEGYAAAMIDGAGLKGFRIGGAQVSEKHAGFVINTGSATFDDFMRVIHHVQVTVQEAYGVMLEPEIKIVT